MNEVTTIGLDLAKHVFQARSRPPSNLAKIGVPETGDSPGGGSIESNMAGAVSLK